MTVRVEKLNPTVQIVHYDTIELDHGGLERTAVRFTIESKRQSLPIEILRGFLGVADPAPSNGRESSPSPSGAQPN